MKTLLVAGGSGGHLIPAMTLAETLRRDSSCLMLSTARSVDKTLADGASSLEWITVDLKIWTPLWRWFSPFYIAHQLGAARQIWTLLRQIHPDVVVGFGGYLSAVGLAAARLQGIPTVIHEQNLVPGRANRWMASLANVVALSFSETARFLPRGAALAVTGNPVRPGLKGISLEKARSHFGFDTHRPVLLIMGGSQGSRAINRAVLKMWDLVLAEDRGRFQVIHLAGSDRLAGSGQFGEIEETYRRLGIEARVFPFLREMELALAAATLAVSRAGATAIAEMVELGLPAILIPYPHAGGHQRANAGWMESAGGAVVVGENQLSPGRLWGQVSALFGDPQRLARMKQGLLSRADGSAAERLGSLVRKVVR
ncbi:MAG: UDP-N-acetylglucosamine--N-acetylmuramyl-(pentapeptide) pyrophosphoryl-undecaprenol N-acetylglucosamine transferase [Candidatus Omnitrophica bacterium]|nr:UDP-N-acetylglucosamine--N-acetylmuramyl-(pentapeptide) pyrophosphoryl-undecaprenol N-acetylglucosamine transferase [Candidatus Omnitrophota bacterium]